MKAWAGWGKGEGYENSWGGMSRERKGSVSGAAGQPQRDQEFAEKGRLKTTLFLCSCRAETITYQQLAEAQSKTCRALGQEINLVIIRGTHSESDAPIPLIAVVAANDPRIFGAYELSNYSDGVVFKRICDLCGFARYLSRAADLSLSLTCACDSAR